MSRAVNITWIGNNNTWTDGGSTAFWNPADEPDSDDTAIFNTDNLVPLGSANTIVALTMSNSIELSLNGNALNVAGLTSLTGTDTTLTIAGATSALHGQDVTVASGATVDIENGGTLNGQDITANNGGTVNIVGGSALNHQNMTINSGGTVFLDGGTVTSSIAGATNALVTIASGGALSGNGTFSLTDTPAATTTIINNNGVLTASNPSTLIITPPTAATLHLTATDTDSRIDLDGSLETGSVNVARNQTLDIDIPLADIFNGAISMTQNTKLDISSAWILGSAATVSIDNGASGGIGGVPAGTSTIAGSSFSQNAGTITVVDTDGTLQFDAPFSMNGGTLTNNGHVIFNQSATIAAAANLDMVGDADLTVEANRTVNINQTNFNFDGSGTSGTVITVNSQGTLNLNVTDYNSDSATNTFNGTLNLTNGDISVNTGDAEFVMDGVLNMLSSVEGEIVAWTGEPLDIGNDAGSLDADLTVLGNRQSQLAGEVDFNSDADVEVAAGATLALLSTVNFDTVNGGNSAQFTGAGTIAFSGVVNVNEAVTLNMSGGAVDLDGLDNVGDFVNIDAPLTINAATMASFGRANGGGGVSTLDINNSAGTGALTVNLDNASAEWTLNSQGVMNLVNDNTEATLLAGNAVNLNGTVNVTGDVRSTARLDIAGTVHINTAGQPFRLGGGDAGPNVNTIAGATISGAGLLGADTGKALQGFGTISTDIDFDGTANLRASGGTLTISGTIVDVNILGTADSTGTLNIVNAWETDGGAGGSIGAVVLNGGVLQGGVITNDNATGLQGNGTITARVINTSRITATNGGTLIVQTSGNDNDWDGAANTGELEALSADLEMIDTTGPVPPVRTFGGKVRAINDNRVFANGFGLNFLPGSTLELEDEAIFQASSSTDIGGTVQINAGSDATIEVANNYFLTFKTGSVTTLDGDLTLKNNNINIKQGATFSGPGALKIPDGSHIVADNLAEVGTLMLMDGAFRPGNFDGIGRVELFDFQESSTSQLFVELTGTALNKFDRLVADGDVIIDGSLNIDIDEISPGVPFVPALGQTFNIITGHTVTGTFDLVDVSGMPAGLAFHINYLPNVVQLQVVSKPLFQADFDDDGDVDATDYQIWRQAYNLNQLGDANGDNQSNAGDWVIWRKEQGSHPGAGAAADGLSAANVPEPTTIGLLAVGIISFACSRRKATASRK